MVYPSNPSNPGRIIIQSDKRMCVIDRDSGHAVLSKNHTYPTFAAWTLDVANGLHEVVKLTPEQLQQVIDAQPKSGDSIGGGVSLA